MTTRWVGNVLTLILGCALVLVLYKYGAKIFTQKQRFTGRALEMSKKVVNVPVGILAEMELLNGKRVAHDDPRLISLIRKYFILPPSNKPYNLINPNKSDYAGQGKDNAMPDYFKNFTVCGVGAILDAIWNNLPPVKGLNCYDTHKGKGFFVECGALNGEDLSHSLYFEKTKHWDGLLVEANPNLFRQLQIKHRKAYTLNACLSIKNYPSVMQFNMHGGFGRLVETTLKEAYKHHGHQLESHLVKLQCFPLYSVLLALNKVKVDFFALDVEGVEVDILNTLPWNKVKITNILAEFTHGPGRAPALKKALESKGYKEMKRFAEDILFYKK